MATQSQEQIWFCCELSDVQRHWICYLSKWRMNFILLLRLEGFLVGFAITWVPGNLTKAAPSLSGNGDITGYGDKEVEWSHSKLCALAIWVLPWKSPGSLFSLLRVLKERGEKASRVCRRIQSPCTCSSNRLLQPGLLTILNRKRQHTSDASLWNKKPKKPPSLRSQSSWKKCCCLLGKKFTKKTFKKRNWISVTL